MGKQMNNIKSVKTQMLPEPSDDNKSSLLLPQVQANNRLMPYKSTPTLGNKHLQHQLPHSSDATMIRLVPTDCVRETSSGTSSAMDSNSTTHCKPTWEMLFLLLITLNIFQWSDSPSQCPRRRCSDRRKRSCIQQIRSKFQLQKQIGTSSPPTS
jgi:hypothetical protein